MPLTGDPAIAAVVFSTRLCLLAAVLKLLQRWTLACVGMMLHGAQHY